MRAAEADGGGLPAAALLSELFAQSAQSSNNVLFVTPQLALAGLIHTVDPVSRNFAYTHLPGLRHAVQLALASAQREGLPQSIVCIGDWSTTLVQAMLTAVNDIVVDGCAQLCWADPGEQLARLEATLHLLMLLGSPGGRYSACAIAPRLGPTHCGVDAAWLWPHFLSTLWREGEKESVLLLPIYQHFLAAPRRVLARLLPPALLPSREDPQKWRELTSLLEAVGAGPEGGDAFLRGLAVVLILLDRPAARQAAAGHDALLCDHCGCSERALRGALQRAQQAETEPRCCSTADALYLLCLDWVCAAASPHPAPPLQLWPLPSAGSAVAQPAAAAGADEEGDGPSVRIVMLPQSAPSFVRPALPPCLAPLVLLGNLASEHLSVWAANALLGAGAAEQFPSARVIAALLGAGDDVLPAVMRCDPTALRHRLPAAPDAAAARQRLHDHPVLLSTGAGGALLSVAHTHRAVRYPLCRVAGAAAVAPAFLQALARFLAPVLASTPLFLHHLPLYVTGQGGAAALYEPLLPDAHAQVEGSVLLAAARQMYSQAAKGRGPARASQQQHPHLRHRREPQQLQQPPPLQQQPQPNQQQPQQQQTRPARHSDPRSDFIHSPCGEVQRGASRGRNAGQVSRAASLSTEECIAALGEPEPAHGCWVRGGSSRPSTPAPSEYEDPFAAKLSEVVHLTKSFRLRSESARKPPPRQPRIGDPLPLPPPPRQRRSASPAAARQRPAPQVVPGGQWSAGAAVAAAAAEALTQPPPPPPAAGTAAAAAPASAPGVGARPLPTGKPPLPPRRPPLAPVPQQQQLQQHEGKQRHARAGAAAAPAAQQHRPSGGQQRSVTAPAAPFDEAQWEQMVANLR
eukprot:TRINITY_DN6392_c3_g1_i1.p1 TRINITY_DN6392_c3_g1~~TRINITY_DN6392_c3_g1_i1.p1  ORF type:complete len:858 (+),score=255.02 TRINITY_DN6392_c3_g1_i1:74-2647(+)